MDSIERQVKNLVGNRRYNVIVAIITDKAQSPDKEMARRCFKSYKREILNCKHPTLYREAASGEEFVFGARDDMEKDEEYLKRFLSACSDEKHIEIVGIRTC